MARLLPTWEPQEPPTPRAPALPTHSGGPRMQWHRHRQDLRGLFGAPGVLSDAPSGASFSEVLAAAVRDGTQQRGRLTLLSGREEMPAPRVDEPKAARVTQTASGLTIVDRRRVWL